MRLSPPPLDIIVWQRVAAPATEQLTWNELMKELWQPIEGYEGLYEVSDQGKVRSLDRVLKSKRTWGEVDLRLKGKILKQGKASHSYLTVNLWSKNKGRTHCIHVLVANAFIGDSTGLDVNHLDGDKANNARSNLEICTRSENMKHAYRTGLWDGNNKVKPVTGTDQLQPA